MPKTHNSWEIILAGVLLTGLAIYMVTGSNYSGNEDNDTASSMVSAGDNSTSSKASQSEQSTMTIKLKQFEEQLSELENNDELKELEQLKELKELKKLQQLINWTGLDDPGELKVKVEGKDKESVRKSIEEAARELEKIDANFPINASDIEISETGDQTYTIKPSGTTSFSGSDDESNVYVQQLDAEGLDLMNISLASSHINIKGYAGDQIVVKVRSTDNDATLEELRNDIDLELTRGQSEANLNFNLADKGWFNFFSSKAYDVTIELPRSIDTKGSTSGGHIKLANLAGTHNLSTSGGHIKLNDVTGNYTLSTSGGHISVNNAEAGMKLTTSGGHISLDEAKGNMEVETSGGNIEGSNLTGSLNAETSGGNIKTGFQEVQGDIILQTSAGNITLNVPQKTSADVNLEGAQVDIGSVFNFSGVKDTGEASGTINGGGATRIDCKTSIGNVTLSGNPNI